MSESEGVNHHVIENKFKVSNEHSLDASSPPNKRFRVEKLRDLDKQDHIEKDGHMTTQTKKSNTLSMNEFHRL